MTKVNRRRRSELLIRCVPMLRAYVRELFDDPEVASDVLQEVMVKLLSLPDAPEDTPGFAELARHTALEVSWIYLLPELESPLEEEPLDPLSDPEGLVDAREALALAVHHLGDEGRELLVRRYVLGENARELSSGRPQSPAALRVRLMRLRSSARSR
jgi:DNA-directed RNA polymerase specialized sigma24 family protein